MEERVVNIIRNITDPIVEIVMHFLNDPYPVELCSHLDLNTIGNQELADHYLNYFEDAIEKFRDQFARRSIQYVSILILLYLLEAAFISVSLQGIGISVDIIGAMILARGLLNGPIIISHQSWGEYTGGNTDLRDSMIQDAIDGLWGIFLLLTGFLLQSIAIL